MQSLQSVDCRLFTVINHEAVTGTIRTTQLFTQHSSHSQCRTPAGHMTVGAYVMLMLPCTVFVF